MGRRFGGSAGAAAAMVAAVVIATLTLTVRAHSRYGQAVRLAAGTWVPPQRMGASRAAFSFRCGGSARALLMGPGGNSVSGAMYVLVLAPGGGSGYQRGSLVRCDQSPRGGRWVDGSSPAVGTAVAVAALPGGGRRTCALAMTFARAPDVGWGWLAGYSAGYQAGRKAAEAETEGEAEDMEVQMEASGGVVRVWLDGVLFQWRDPLPLVLDAAFLQVGAGSASEAIVRLPVPESHWANNVNGFCVITRNCPCQPGYTGEFCSIPCASGRWGAGCTGRCGRCRDGAACDAATGSCPFGCQDGYAPPLCAQEVARLTAPAQVRAVNSTALLVWAPVRGSAVPGAVVVAIVEYRPATNLWGGAAEPWRSLPPQPLRCTADGGAEVRAVITGLRPAAIYQVRVVLRTAQAQGVSTASGPLCLIAACDTDGEEVNYFISGKQAKDHPSIRSKYSLKPGENNRVRMRAEGPITIILQSQYFI